MSDPHRPLERTDTLRVEYIPDHTIRFALIKATFRPACDDPASILTPMLQ